jgi:phosphoglucomutase/phosphomannomutase
VVHAVATTGQPVFVASYAQLAALPAYLDERDGAGYPDGIDDAQSGFGSSYAVPLRLSSIVAPRDAVVGVFTIERRRTRHPDGAPRRAFDAAERAAFACVAEHLAAILRSHAEAVQAQRSDASAQADLDPDGFFSIVNVRVEPIVPSGQGDEDARARDRRAAEVTPLVDAASRGFGTLDIDPDNRETALRNLQQWLMDDAFAAYREQLEWLVGQERWPLLLDSFYRVLPFGTGGRRGPVGIGTNRYNDFTLASSVEGHADYLREVFPDQSLSVVIAYDVRCFYDVRGLYQPDLPNPVLERSSRDFARIAAEVYAGKRIRVYMLPTDSDSFMSTPELSYTIRALAAQGGLNISASHNPPDDNGGKFYNEHGAQHVPPKDEVMAKRVEGVRHLTRLDFEDAARAGWIRALPSSIHDEYVDLNVQQSLRPDARSARVVFTPLHGTGSTTVAEALTKAGFQVDLVASQSSFDGRFPAVPFQAPNPEVPESMQAGRQLADELGADLVMACDPDADRIGVCARSSHGDFVFLNGNEIAVLVTHHKLAELKRLGQLPKRPVVIKTEVTTELLRPITEHFGGVLIGDLLVGFKYHGHVLELFERGEPYGGVTATLDDFVSAVEESHGVLTTTEVRDKDAAGAAMHLAELASQLKARGATITQYLDDIYRRYGYHATQLSSMVMTGAEGIQRMRAIQQALREHPPQRIGRWAVSRWLDHRDERGIHGPKLSETDWVARDILAFYLDNGARVIVRPSGTEPKNKIYIEVPRTALGEQASDTALANEKQEAQAIATEISDDFNRQMLATVGVELPTYALRISGLVSLENRLDFVQRFLPEFERRAAGIPDGSVSRGELSAWIDDNLATYGKDARGLVGAAVDAYLTETREQASPEHAVALDAMRSVFFTDTWRAHTDG